MITASESARAKGILFAILSGSIYGCMPIGATVLYAEGVTPLALVFLRNALAIPVLALFCLLRRKTRMHASSVRKAAAAGWIGSAATPLLLYLSYTEIDTGTATTLHYIYPALVTVFCSVFFRDRMRPLELICLFLSMAGVGFLCFRGGPVSPAGVLCAAGSAFTFAAYVTLIGKTELKDADPFLLALICCSSAALLLGPIVCVLQPEGLPASLRAWLISAVFAAAVCAGAMTLFKKATQIIGPQLTGILSTFEPLTGILIGVLFLGEPFGPSQITGSALVFASVILLSVLK